MEYVFCFLSDSAIKTKTRVGNPDRVTLDCIMHLTNLELKLKTSTWGLNFV